MNMKYNPKYEGKKYILEKYLNEQLQLVIQMGYLNYAKK